MTHSGYQSNAFRSAVKQSSWDLRKWVDLRTDSATRFLHHDDVCQSDSSTKQIKHTRHSFLLIVISLDISSRPFYYTCCLMSMPLSPATPPNGANVPVGIVGGHEDARNRRADGAGERLCAEPASVLGMLGHRNKHVFASSAMASKSVRTATPVRPAQPASASVSDVTSKQLSLRNFCTQMLRPVQWADVRLASIASAVILALCVAATVPSLWPRGLDGACYGVIGYNWNGNLSTTSSSHSEVGAAESTAMHTLSRLRLADGKAHLGLAMLGLGILIALSGVRSATRPGTLHVRAFKVQALVISEVIICNALMATGNSAPMCRVSGFRSSDLSDATLGGRQATGTSACIGCAQRYMLRYASWWAGQVATLGLVAHILRMRRVVAATVLVAISFNLATGVAMSFHALEGMGWVFAHAAIVIYLAGLYTMHSWPSWRIACSGEACSPASPGSKLGSGFEGHGRKAGGLADEFSSQYLDPADPCTQRVSPRLAAFAGACAVFILAVRFVAGAVQLRVPCCWRPFFDASEDAVVYLLAPLAIVSGEVLSDARLLTARLAAAEAHVRTKRDILRFFSHEVSESSALGLRPRSSLSLNR